MLLEISNLSKRYGGLWAIQNVNIGIETGELRGIIGPNGAGKSTLFNLIIGREQPTTGTVVFRGRNIEGLRPDQRARLGITIKFQITNIFGSLSIKDNVRLGLAGCLHRFEEPSDRKGRDESAMEILSQIGLADKAGSPAGSLSHGEKQWLEIGMALATNPALLLLDEPTSGMGREETQKTAELITQLKGNLTILVIEHDMDFVRSVSERITVFYRGSVLTEGTYNEVKTDQRVIEAYLGRGR
jgi:branched-chain amino acid transport system ATP-binding protein